MELIIGSTKDVSSDISTFSEGLSYDSTGEMVSNYQVSIEGFLFEYRGNLFLSKDILEEIVQVPLDCPPVEISFQEFSSKMCYGLLYADTVYSKITEEDLRLLCRRKGVDNTPRLATFMVIVQQYLDMPIEKVYELSHESSDDLFNDFMMWDACFILLSNGRGLVVIAGAYD